MPMNFSGTRAVPKRFLVWPKEALNPKALCQIVGRSLSCTCLKSEAPTPNTASQAAGALEDERIVGIVETDVGQAASSLHSSGNLAQDLGVRDAGRVLRL